MSSATIWVIMHSVYALDGEGNEPFLCLERGDWMSQEGFCGTLGFREPSDAHFFKQPCGSQEAFMVAEAGSSPWGYIGVPHSCLSSNSYNHHDNLWIVKNPEVEGEKITLMKVEEDGHRECIVVAKSEIMEDLKKSLEKDQTLDSEELYSDLEDLIVSRDKNGWFDPIFSEEGNKRHRESIKSRI